MRNTEDEAYDLIEEMVFNNFQCSTEGAQPTQVGGKLEVDAFGLLSAKVDAMTKRLDKLNGNAVNSSALSPCEICGSIEHIFLHFQVESPFSHGIDEVNYVQNFNPRPTNDPYSNTYNPGWRNHPNLSYRLNMNLVNILPLNARVPPGFQRFSLPSQMPQKSNFEVMMENMLMAQ